MKKKYVLLSLLIHTLFLVFVSFEVTTHETEKNHVIQIELKETRKVVKNVGSKMSRQNHGASKSKKGLSYGLFPKMTVTDLLARVEKHTKAQSEDFNFDEGVYNDSRTYDKGIGEIFGDNGNQSWAHFQEVYRRIDSNLVFDSLLAQYNHFGRVYVQFKLTEDGLFILDNLKAEAADPILKVHVLRAIQKSLNTPFELTKRSKLLTANQFRAEFNFNFGNPYYNSIKQNGFGKPVFVFNRFTEEKPVPSEMMDHLLSGGINLNVSAMYERWKKYNKKKHREEIKFDPFISYRKDPFYSI